MSEVQEEYEDNPIDVSEGAMRFKAARWHVASLFPKCSSGVLWREVFMQAVMDASGYVPGELNTFHQAEAYEYLSTPVIPACELCGVDSDYARRVLTQAGLLR